MLSPLHSNLLDFGGLTGHRRSTRDTSTSLCSSASEIRENNRVTYQENIEEESGGFEEGGEKTRFGTLQKQRTQLNNDFRATSNSSGNRAHGNQVSSTFFNQKTFEYSMCAPYWENFVFRLILACCYILACSMLNDLLEFIKHILHLLG